MKLFVLKLICKIIGHRDDVSDCGYAACSRCELHSVYNEDEYFKTIPTWYWNLYSALKWNLSRWFENYIYKKCYDCKKTEMIFTKEIGNHKNCLPF